MLELPEFAVEERDTIASSVRRHPWATVANASRWCRWCHRAPVLLDGVEGELVTISSHPRRRDAGTHRLLDPGGEPR